MNIWKTICTLAFGIALYAEPQHSSGGVGSNPLDRRIESIVRSHFNVPVDYTVSIGTRKPSVFVGFDTLTVTFTRNEKSTTAEFLISSDNKKLARLEEFDLTSDPLMSISTEGRPVRGDLRAPITVISFDDLECPFCSRMHQVLFPKTLEHYGDKVRFVYKDSPLTEIHPWAMHAAIDANCLAAQSGDSYWHYLDYVHSHGQEINGESRDLKKSFAALDSIATETGSSFRLDSTHLRVCLQKQDETQIRASLKEAEALHVEGTPVLIVNGERVNGGAVPAEQLWLVIDRALRAVGVQPPSASPNISAKQAIIGKPNISGSEERIH